MQINSHSILKLIETATSDENKTAYRSQSPQLIAFAVVGLVYGVRTNWSPTENISSDTKLELRDIANNLNIDKTAYETFIASVRRMIRKICEFCADEKIFDRIKNASDEREGLTELLSFLADKNIFTAAHMRIWALTNTTAPLDLTRRTGDSARYRKSADDASPTTRSNYSGRAEEICETTLALRSTSKTNSDQIAIFAVRHFSNGKEFIKISSNFQNRAELNAEIDRLQNLLEMLRIAS